MTPADERDRAPDRGVRADQRQPTIWRSACSIPRDGYYTTREPFGAAAISSPRRKSARCSASWSASGSTSAWQALGRPTAGHDRRDRPRPRHADEDILRTLVAPGRRRWRRERPSPLIETSPRLSSVQKHTLAGRARRDFTGTRPSTTLPDDAAADRRQRVLRRHSDPPIRRAAGRLARAHGRARRRRRALLSSPASARIDPALLPADAAGRAGRAPSSRSRLPARH